MRVLLVEDSQRLQRSLTRGLRGAGFSVDSAFDGEEGLWRARHQAYDTIILDLMLPKIDGMEVLRTLRAAGIATHVLILTARGEMEDRLRGFDAGGDDYLVKPFALAELLARLRAMCRRAHGGGSTVLRLADIEIDTSARRASRHGAVIPLTPREFKLLELLTLRRGEVLSKTQIENCIYDERVEPMSNVVESAISTLRRKLGTPDGLPIIQTRRGMGYFVEGD